MRTWLGVEDPNKGYFTVPWGFSTPASNALRMDQMLSNSSSATTAASSQRGILKVGVENTRDKMLSELR